MIGDTAVDLRLEAIEAAINGFDGCRIFGHPYKVFTSANNLLTFIIPPPMYNECMMNRILVCTTLVASFLLFASLHAQQEMRKQAPPEIRELIGAVVTAVNGNAADFEAFAQAKFAPDLLKQQALAERQALHQKLADTFGQIAVDSVRKEGPDGPMLLQVKGSKGDGVIEMEIDSSATPRITFFSPQ